MTEASDAANPGNRGVVSRHSSGVRDESIDRRQLSEARLTRESKGMRSVVPGTELVFS